jgi:plasmid maintenance system antidote protein VapI
MRANTARLRPPVHPGRILKEDLLEPLGISLNKLAAELGVPAPSRPIRRCD